MVRSDAGGKHLPEAYRSRRFASGRSGGGRDAERVAGTIDVSAVDTAGGDRDIAEEGARPVLGLVADFTVGSEPVGFDAQREIAG